MPAPAIGIAVRIGVSLLQTKKGRAIAVGAVLLLVGMLLAVPLSVAALATAATSVLSNAAAGQAESEHGRCMTPYTPGSATGTDGPATPGSPGAGASTLTAEQQTSARTIVGLAKNATFNALGAVDETQQKFAAATAISTAWVESRLVNVNYGDRDSLGLFQQRPSQGWGTEAQVQDPVYSTIAFWYGVPGRGVPGMVDIEGWQTLPLGRLAQAVQRSAFPERYAEHADFANNVVTDLWGDTPAITIPADLQRTNFPAAGSGTLLPGGDPSCATPWTPPTEYVAPGAWGGYQNGRIPAGALMTIPWAPHHSLRADAAAAVIALNEKYKAEHGGKNLTLTDTYRTYETQVRLKASWCARGACQMAATPGTSNHGWALAIDFGGSGNSYTGPDYLWLKANAPAYGWTHPDWAEPSSPKFRLPEPWHWEFTGAPKASA